MDPSRTSSSVRPSGASSGDRFGRVIKKFRSALNTSPVPENSVAAHIPIIRNDASYASPSKSIIARSPSPPISNIAALTFNEPIIADDDGDDDALLYDEEYNTLLKDAQFRARPRQLFDRYGLDFERSGLTVSPRSPTEVPRARVLRAEKSVRVRVRYNCCQCDKTFGSAPVCTGCNHERCKTCPRYPPRKKTRPFISMEELRDAHPPPIAVSMPRVDSEHIARPIRSQNYIHMPTRVNYQAMQPPPVMINRLRRICHVCDQGFQSTIGPACDACGHKACPSCMRDSTALLLKRRRSSSSGSEPGDIMVSTETTSQSTAAIRSIDNNASLKPPESRTKSSYTCDQCDADFVYGSSVCGDCLHSRCRRCEKQATRSLSRSVSADPLPFAGEIGASGGLRAA